MTTFEVYTMMGGWLSDHHNWAIAIGTALIAFGGFVATYGWDARSTKQTRNELHLAETQRGQQQRRAMLQILAAELQVNTALLRHSVFTETDPEKLKLVRVIPRFNDSALSAAVASGLFIDAHDQKLLDAIMALENSIIYFSQFTEVYHGILIKASYTSDEGKRHAEIHELWSGLKEAASLKQIKDNIELLQSRLDEIRPKIEIRTSWPLSEPPDVTDADQLMESANPTADLP